MNDPVRFRAEQRAIIDSYRGGKLGIAAVPGSGKTFTLSYLAARLVELLVAESTIEGLDRQEVLVVTFTNSAVNHFRNRIATILQQERRLLSYVGYRVRTLHGLAHDIVRERPALVGLAEDFQIVDDRLSYEILQRVVHSHLPDFRAVLEDYLIDDLSDSKRAQLMRKDLPERGVELGITLVKHAKNYRLSPESLAEQLARQGDSLPLVEFGLAVYRDYERSLAYRGAVDFDDLVRLALDALEIDPDYCARLQKRWPYILEDEAQDSSWLQEQMLFKLSNNTNWVRVGDPNQAINTTFTTADPAFLRRFIDREDVQTRELTVSGRSARPIIRLANRLVDWSVHEHPTIALRDAFREQYIQPTAPDDPQPNPPEEERCLYIHIPSSGVTPEKEISLVVENIARYLQRADDVAERSLAVLVPENSRGFKLVEELRRREIPFDDSLLRSTAPTREAVGLLRDVMAYLCQPDKGRELAQLYRNVWRTISRFEWWVDEETAEKIAAEMEHLREVERFLWPVGSNWLDDVSWFAQVEGVKDELRAFRETVVRWLDAVVLPADQLVLTLVQDLFEQAADIALGHKIAGLFRSLQLGNSRLALSDFLAELEAITRNQRKFLGFDDTELGYEPRPGVVTVATMHAAKGLEWDRVYLMGVNSYSFPSAEPNDRYRAEYWFIRDSLNLEAEALAQLAVLRADPGAEYVEGQATQQARLDYAAERLRLLYVGITRAKRNLMITWNMGRYWNKGEAYRNSPALPLAVLHEFVRDDWSGVA